MMRALQLAILFHNTYENLAPKFGYETRPDTRAFDPASPNGLLMMAVAQKVLDVLEGENAHLREQVRVLRETCKEVLAAVSKPETPDTFDMNASRILLTAALAATEPDA